MAEFLLDLAPIPVLRVRADWHGAGPPAAFAALEARLATLKGRRFYGVYRGTPEGEEYYACVARIEGDDLVRLGLETGTIPGGRYARRKIYDWARDPRQIGIEFREMVQVLGASVDASRPAIEFYRSHAEVQLFEPVKPFDNPSTLRPLW